MKNAKKFLGIFFVLSMDTMIKFFINTIFIWIVTSIHFTIYSQIDSNETIKTISKMDRSLRLNSNDSIDKLILLPQFEVYSLRTFLKKKDQRKYDRLVRHVKKVYPFAKLAGERMKAYAMVMESMTKKERKNLVRSFEEEIKKTHGQDLRKLTPAQGRILLKLIDRETGNTPYELIEDLRGSFAAIFWQITASFFDFDLKEGFDPKSREEDLYIDEICRMIDAGQL